MNISVLIPWRETGPERRRVFDWVLTRCRTLLPSAQICLGDSGHEIFNRGASLNQAAQQADGDVLVLADADTFFHRDQILDAAAWSQECETWVLPYDIYMNLDDTTTERLLTGLPDDDVDPAQVGAEFRLRDSVSGLIVITRAGFVEVGGFDENFRGWGYEDRAFECAANTLLNRVLRMEGYCYHLAHPPTMRFEQPQIDHNRARSDEYRRLVGKPDQIRQMMATQ